MFESLQPSLLSDSRVCLGSNAFSAFITSDTQELFHFGRVETRQLSLAALGNAESYRCEVL